MFKSLSTPELNFHQSYLCGLKKFKKLPNFDKYMTFFWFLGPFIFLIERDPADLWITILGISFLYKCYKDNNWSWTSQWWFKFALLFWLTGLVSALLSSDIFFSFKEGFVWIRFPVYAAAAQVWLAKDRDIRIMMLISMLVGMIIISVILLTEFLIDYKPRLEWPYGDKVPGGYIAKVSLPLFCSIIAIAVSRSNLASFLSSVIGIITIVITVMTGERIHSILRTCAGILAGLVWKPKFKLIFFLIFFEFIALATIIYISPARYETMVTRFIHRIPIFTQTDENPYWGAWRGGIQQAVKTPIIGIGPSGTRKTCVSLDTLKPVWLPGKNYCGNHPHNFYIQMFAETGIIGFTFGSLMIIFIIKNCYRIRKKNPNCPMAATAFVIPFAIFFPLQQFGSLYGQWGNLFIWFAVGFSISQIQDFSSKNN